ncbi:MAG: hypothetical protein IT425_10500 [Pirellulales bacterium]|nr:hypothetical protein [Pirellulales bacterium]
MKYSLLLLPLIATCFGCGKSSDTVPASGSVTFAGGPPPAEGTIIFTPVSVAEGFPKRPGRAHFDTSGHFTVTTYQSNDGLLPGTYRPSIECWMGKPDSNDPSSFDRLNHVPKGFQAQEITVSRDSGSVNVSIDIPKKH